MLRKITKKVNHPESKELFKAVGTLIDLPHVTWKRIVRNLYPTVKEKDLMKALDSFSEVQEIT